MKNNMIRHLLAGLMIVAFLGWGGAVFAQNPYSEGEFGIPTQLLLSDLDRAESGLPLVMSVGCSMHGQANSESEYDDVYAKGEMGIPDYPIRLADNNKSGMYKNEDFVFSDPMAGPGRLDIDFDNCYARLEGGGFSPCSVE